VVRAVRTRAPEYWVGASTLMTIVGNMISPEFLDWYLARTAVDGQETAQGVRPDRHDNLFAPVTGLHRTRGSFGAHAENRAMIFPAGLTRAAIVIAGALLFFLLGVLAAA
jgi:hypothetical protein